MQAETRTGNGNMAVFCSIWPKHRMDRSLSGKTWMVM